MSSIQPLNCACCGRRIGRRAAHFLVGQALLLLCRRCVFDCRSHARLFPQCIERWHDVFDHGPVHHATRGAANELLNIG